MSESGNDSNSRHSLNLIEESNSSMTDSSLSMNLEDVETRMQRLIMMKKTFNTIAVKGVFFSLEKINPFIELIFNRIANGVRRFTFDALKEIKDSSVTIKKINSDSKNSSKLALIDASSLDNNDNSRSMIKVGKKDDEKKKSMFSKKKEKLERKIEEKKEKQKRIIEKEKQTALYIEKLNQRRQMLDYNQSFESESLFSMSFDTTQRIKNGIELLSYIVNNHIRFQKMSVFSAFLIRLTKANLHHRSHSSSKPKHDAKINKPKPRVKSSNKYDLIVSRALRQQENELFKLEDVDVIIDERKRNANKKQSERRILDRATLKKYNIYEQDKLINSSDDDELNENEFLINTSKEHSRLDSKKKSKRKLQMPEEVIEESTLINDTITSKKLNANEHFLIPPSEDDQSETQNLIEYDKFYKEEFFTKELFQEETHVKNKEEDEIKKEIDKLKMKKLIKEKEKIRDVNAMKGFNVAEMNKEINHLKEEYQNMKKFTDNTIDLHLNTVEQYFHKGIELNNYFQERGESKFPKFTISNEKEIKSKEIIDFKPLHKEEQIRRYYDKWCCLKMRKTIFKWKVIAKYYCGFIVENQYFDNLSLLVIILNTVLILISDPRDNKSIANTSDSYFLYFYTAEAVLKILGFGFWASEKAYIKDPWNILDFFVVLIGWVSFILEHTRNSTKISGLAGLRAFRILRPLKTVKRIKGLRRIVVALFASLSRLTDIIIVLMFFFLMFAIAGVQMWQGNFLKRCMSLRYGFYSSYDDDEGMCTFDSDCESLNSMGNKYVCVKGFRNPNNGVITFDNTLMGFVTVFTMVTLEGWTNVFVYVSKTFKDKIYINPIIVFLYFHGLIFIGGFYLMNLFLAVTNSEFMNIEKIRKAFFEKPSFLQLMKSKYDLKEKEKQEKKRKEKELKKRNKQRKTEDDLTDLQIKIEDEAFEIRKRAKDIPLSYTTVKDMYILQNNNPEELYKIAEMIDEEKTFLKKDIKRQLKNLYSMSKQKRKEKVKKVKKEGKSALGNSNEESQSTEENKDNRNILTEERQKIYSLAVQFAIKDAQKILKQKMISIQSVGFLKKAETIDLLRQKIEKKEIEKFNMNQISIEEDLSFEKDQKNREAKKKGKERVKKKTQEVGAKAQNKKKNQQLQLNANQALKNASNVISTNPIAPPNKQMYRKIDEDLSFMTDLTYSSADERDSKDNTVDQNLTRNQIEDSKVFSRNDISTIKAHNNLSSSVITNEPIEINNEENESMIDADKKIICNGKDKIFDDVLFPKPSSMLPELLLLQSDAVIQSKLEKMRNHFKVDKYLNKREKVGDPICSLARKGSFLNFLRFTDEKNNKEKLTSKLDNDSKIISKKDLADLDEGNEEDNKADKSNSNLSISISIKTMSDESVLPKDLPINENVFDADVEYKDVNREIKSNKYEIFGRQRFLDKNCEKSVMHYNGEQLKKFFCQMNEKLNDNVLIDSEAPLGRLNNESIQSHVFVDKDFSFTEDAENAQKVHRKLNSNGSSSMSEQIQNRKKNRKKGNNETGIFKSPSVEKNLYKYPLKNSNDLIVQEVNEKMTDTFTPQQENISQNWRSKKYYMNYLYNIKDKDLKVKDNFKIDTWKSDVLGKEKRVIHLKPLPESTEAVFVFNDKSLNLKKYRYFQNKPYEFDDDECAYLTHNLTNLPISILQIMPPRMRDFGRYAVGKEVRLGTLAKTSTMSKTSSTIMTTSTAKSSAMMSMSNIKSRASKSTIGIGSAFANTHKMQDETKYRKGIYEKIYRKIDDFNYKTLSHYFLEEETLYYKLADDNHREEKDREIKEKNKQKQDVLEVQSTIRDVKLFDMKTNSSRYVQWSGQDVLYLSAKTEENYDKYNDMINSLENFGVIIWIRTPGMKVLQKIRYSLYLVSINTFFDILIILIVITNSVIMALDGNMFTPEQYSTLNVTGYVFNGIFIAEFIMKFIGLGPIVYFSDPFTYLDLLIIIFAIVDMTSSSSSSADTIGSNKSVSSQLSFLRVFRIFRVLRLTKILRKLKSMRLIIVSIQKSIINLLYILLILLMFILIFQLLGMSLLNGNLRFQSFMISFYTTFQILTVESWQKLLFELFPLSKFVFFYFLIWIFLGNYILFNLFISILLQAFDDSDKDEDDEDTMIEKQFGLPDYLYKLKLEEVHHQNRMKSLKFRKSKLTDMNEFNSASESASMSKMSRTSMSGISNQSVDNQTEEESTTNVFGESQSELGEDEDNMKVLTGIDKSIKNWKKVNVLFRKNECENSLYIFSQINTFRIWCMKIVSTKIFDHCVLFIICLSTIKLILGTTIRGYRYTIIFDFVDFGLNILFTFEMILKVVALGFVLDEGSYLRDNWNKIDLVIVIVSLIDIQSIVTKYFQNNNTNSNSMNFLKVLRLLRTLRPLRFISHNAQLRLLITSLFDSILPITNALFIVLIVLFMFSIVGINLFYNLYHNCFIPGKNVAFKIADNDFSDYLIQFDIPLSMPAIESFCAERYNGIMDTGPMFKFSNIFNSLITSYILGTMEGWPEIMQSYRVFNDYYGIFFLVIILVVSYFFLNLFTGIMFKYFNDAWTKEKKIGEDDKKAEKYYDFLNQIESAEPDYNSYLNPKEGTVKYYLVMIANSKILDNFIMLCIFLNMVVMAINYDGTGPTYTQLLDTANLVFTAIFIGEATFKIIALGPTYYFFFGWNQFDFFVVIASIADLIIARIDGIDAAFLKSFQIIRVLRVLRVTRVLRLFRSLKSLEKLLQTLRWSMASLLNVFLLMFLMYFIFAILGCYLYRDTQYKDYKNGLSYVSNYYNFDNFYNAFLLVFRCATGENWHNIMYDLAFIDETKVGQSTAYAYMICTNFVSKIIMLNLFLMVTLQQYDEFTNKSFNPVEMFESFITEFKEAWNKYSDRKDKGYRIRKMLITNFFMDFNWKKLNFPEENKLEHIKKYVLELKLKSDQESYVYFHEVLFKIIVMQMGSKIDRTMPYNTVIVKLEKKVADLIRRKINKYIQSHEINKTKKKNLLCTFNPLTSHLYFKISYLYFKTFINCYKENLDHFIEQDEGFSSGTGSGSNSNASREDTSGLDHVKLFEEYLPNTREVVKVMDSRGSNSEYSQPPVSDMSNGLLVDGERRDSTKLA